VPRWHFHDLRRTFRSHARRIGIDRDITELMLNHKRKAIEGVYDRNEELELRAAGVAASETFLAELAASVGCADRLGCTLRSQVPQS
jgi:integrase